MEDLLAIICMDLLVVAVISIIPAWIMLNRKTAHKKLKLTAYMYVLTFLTRYSVELVDRTGFISGMSPVGKLVNSAIRSFSALSFGTDYTGFIVAGKAYFEAEGIPFLGQIYEIVVLYLSIAAPLCTGALLLGILTSVLPGLRIRLHVRRSKFVFSSLNERSIAMAEDLVRDDNYRACFPEKSMLPGLSGPLIIFANTGYSAGGPASGLSGRAAAINAVCVRSDATGLMLRHSRSVHYLLMDDEAGTNIRIMSRLLTPDEKGRFLWPVEGAAKGSIQQSDPLTGIYVFTEDMADASTIKRVLAKKQAGAESALVRTINSEMNTAFNLMNEVPLFLPMLEESPVAPRTNNVPDVNAEGKYPAEGTSGCDCRNDTLRELHVVVIGDGRLAQEMFKSVFWCGQMLYTVLKLTSISSRAGQMKEVLAETCPELLESCRSHSSLLKTHPYGPDRWNQPYADVDFISVADIKQLTAYPQELLEKADYFIVAAGDDRTDIHIAEKLRIALSGKMLAGSARNPVIAVSVSDPELNGSVYVRAREWEPQVVAFGDLTSRYSCRNVFMSNFTEDALSAANRYNKSSQRKAQNDEYAYWANMARTIHAPYKAFSLGRVIRDSSRTCGYSVVPGPALKDPEKDAFAWLEHRRWNAFMRTQGFTLVSGTSYDHLYAVSHMHKSVDLKLHNCLVESEMIPCALPAPAAVMSGDFEKAAYDCLDYVTMNAWKKDGAPAEGNEDVWSKADYRLWDYPEYDDGFQSLTGL